MTDVMREAVTERERMAFAIRRADASGAARAITPHTRRTEIRTNRKCIGRRRAPLSAPAAPRQPR